LRPARDGAIVAGREAEHGFRRRNDSRLRSRSLGERRYGASGKQHHQRHAGDYRSLANHSGFLCYKLYGRERSNRENYGAGV